MTINYSKQVLLKRGNTAVSSTYVGPLGEVTVDTDLGTIRVHDGVTPGGQLSTSSASGETPPSSPRESGLWYDTISGRLYVYYDGAWIDASPAGDVLLNANVANLAAQVNGLNSNVATVEEHIILLDANVGTINANINTLNETIAAFEAQPGPTSDAWVDDAPPDISNVGALWYDDQSGRLYVYYAGTWVDANPPVTTGFGNVLPSANVTYSLGSEEYQWKDLWVSNNTIYIGNTPLSVQDGVLLIDGNPVSGGTADLGKFIFDSEGDSAFISTTDDAGASPDRYDIVLVPGGEGNSSIRVPSQANSLAGHPLIIEASAANSAVVINTENGSWTFGSDGNLTLPNGDLTIGHDPYGDPAIIGAAGKSIAMIASGVGDGYDIGSSLIWVDSITEPTKIAGVTANNPLYVGAGDVGIVTGDYLYTGNTNVWNFGADGTLTVPGAITMPEETGIYSPGHDLYITAGNTTGCSVPGGDTIISSGLGYSGVAHNGGNVTLRTGDYYNKIWNFDYNGNLTLPANLSIGYIGDYIPVDGTIIKQADNEWIQILTTGNEATTKIGWLESLGDGANVAEMTFNNFPGQARIVTGQYGEQINTWQFRPDGNLVLPTGGNILNSDNSVYGGGGTPAGNTGEIQVNIDGAFGSYDTLTYVDNGGEMTLGADYVNTGGLFVSDIYSRDIASNVNITSVYGTNWKFGSDGTTTIPGDIISTAGPAITFDTTFETDISPEIHVKASKLTFIADSAYLNDIVDNTLPFNGVPAMSWNMESEVLTWTANSEIFASTSIFKMPYSDSSNVGVIAMTGPSGGSELSWHGGTDYGRPIGQFIKSSANVSISTNAGFNWWIFGDDGTLTLPASSGQIGISGYTNGMDLYNNNGTGYVRMNYDDQSFVWADAGGAHIQAAGTYTWDFDTEGKLTAPGKIQTTDTTNSISTTTGALVVGGGAGIHSDVHIGGTLNITDTTPSDDYTTGALVVAGGIGVNGNINLTGNINILNGNINIQEFTGSTGNFYGDVVTGFNAFYAGKTGFTALPYTVAQFSTASNTYSQINMENTSTGKLASADFVGTADIGTDASWFFDIGIANSGYDPVLAAENNAPGTAIGPLDAYYYVQGNVDVPATGGNLAIGTSQTGKAVKIFAGGVNAADVILTVTENGVVVTQNLTAPNLGYAADVAAANAAIVTSNSTMLANVNAANAAIITANTAMKSYVDSRSSTYSNTNVTAYIAGSITTGNISIVPNFGNISFNNGAYIAGNITGREGSIILSPAATGTFPGVMIGGSGRLLAPNGSVHQIFNASDVTFQVAAKVIAGTVSTSTTTGALVVSGGAGVAGNLYIGGNIVVSGANGITATGNITTAGKFVGDGSKLSNVTVSVAGNIIGTQPNVTLVSGNYSTVFANNGAAIFPGNVITTGTFSGSGSGLTGVAVITTGTWTVTTGTNTYSFTVPVNGVYQLWVECNIPNGILAYNATATVTNSNVPVVGQQFAWVYNGGGTPVDFTSIPNQFIGTGNTIVRSSVAPSATTNRFDFGINNTSGSSQTVSWGYVRLD